jgi:DNA-binding transcriptional regulator YiaG
VSGIYLLGLNKIEEMWLTIKYTLRIITTMMTGEELKKIRKRLGLTQVEFAALVGVAPNSIARQERGEMGIRGPLAKLTQLFAEHPDLVKKICKSGR